VWRYVLRTGTANAPAIEMKYLKVVAKIKSPERFSVLSERVSRIGISVSARGWDSGVEGDRP
jgi:hypothetical protein